MLVIRPIAAEDLPALYSLAAKAGFGLTTLPRDRKILKERIEGSTLSFLKRATKPGGEKYLFVLEDQENGKICGTTGVVSKVGGFEPFYAYEIKNMVYQSKQLGVRNEIKVLNLVEEHNGPSEIGTLFLSAPYRGGGNGKLLSRSRFMFMADHLGLFEKKVIAELRGVIDRRGRSPFWEAVGRHFFNMDFPKADLLSMHSKTFIAELMPRHPLYVPLLPEKAREVIGQVHPWTVPARRLLEAEGFADDGTVDIFEAGPTVSCQTRKIRTVVQSRCSNIIGVQDAIGHDQNHLMSNRGFENFRACKGKMFEVSEGVITTPEVLQALKLGVGDSLRWISMSSQENVT